jgi:GT2 family glycosyltransferase
MTRMPLSVVVGLISGKKADLRRCLSALAAQTEPPLEILVPYDEPCADVSTLCTEFPAVRFIRAEGLDTRAARAGASREHHDTLRTIGLRAAKGDAIALTEDHAHAAPDWCAEMLAALERQSDAGAVGGAVECDSSKRLNRAVWFCDFGRYQNPLPEGRAAFVSDSNVVYRRSALEAIADAWRDDYHETVVHGAMAQRGFGLYTTPRTVVWQARGTLRLREALFERYVWARSFAGTRATMPSAKRLVLAALSPALPMLMTWRIVKTTLQRGAHTGDVVGVLPLILLLQVAWAWGECVGYLTARPR